MTGLSVLCSGMVWAWFHNIPLHEIHWYDWVYKKEKNTQSFRSIGMTGFILRWSWLPVGRGRTCLGHIYICKQLSRQRAAEGALRTR